MRLGHFWPLALSAITLSGCAGGWRNGPPPGTDAAGTASATAGEAPTAPAKAPAAAAAPAPGGGTASMPDGVHFMYGGPGNSVNVAGEFNSWNTSADALTKQADGSWSLVKKLDPGRYAYKFVIDGGTWKPDDSAKESVDDGFGGKNSIVVVGAGAGQGGATTAAAGATPVAPTAAPPASAVTGKAAPPQVTPDGVKFTYAGAADQVSLAGDFNAWSTTADPMTRQADGTWTMTKKLAPGSYAYKFLVNAKTWKQDEANSESKDDGFGGKNSVVTVQ